MAYRMTEMAAKVSCKPREAAIEIAEAYEKHAGHAQKVAASFEIEYRTLLRWVDRLADQSVRKGVTLRDAIDNVRAKAASVATKAAAPKAPKKKAAKKKAA